MFGRFLSFLGFIPGLSGLSGFAGGYGSGGGGGGADEDMESGGEASVSFTPGKPLASADAEETPDSKQSRITDRDLVWPGKVETIHVGNPEPIAYRFDLTVTDLNPAFYIRRPPLGGTPQREGGILLQPGEEASFEVVFVPPPTGEKRKTQAFGFVLTCFDPRRTGDPGEIVQDLPLRWVGLPTEGDLQITAVPPFVVTRPWRREARFAVRLANKSFLPPTVGMTILRAPTKDALERDAETVGDIQQALTARTPGVWQCLLPPPAHRGSYYATVRGAAQAAGSISTPLALARPVRVRYVPWLRMGRDWVALLGILLFLFWLVWGVPSEKHPVIVVTPAFEGLEAGQLPDGVDLRDLDPTMTLLDEDNTPLAGQQPIVGSFNGSQLVFKGPARLYGYRWPIGWSWPGRAHQRYQLSLAPKAGKEPEFSSYTFPATSDAAYLNITKVAGLRDEWKVQQTIKVARSPGALVLINIGDLGGLRGKDIKFLTVNYLLDGQQHTRICPVYRDRHNAYEPVKLDVTDQVPQGKTETLILSATALQQKSNDSGVSLPVRRQKGAFTFPDALSFPETLTLTPEQIAAAARAEARAKSRQDEADKRKQAQAAAAATSAGASGSAASSGRTAAAVTPPVIVPPQPPVTPRPAPTSPPTTSDRPPTPTLPPVAAVKVPVLPPPTPTGLVAQPAGPTQINVHWDSVPNGAVYLLYRSGGSGGGKWPQSTRNNFFSDTTVTPGGLYHYRVQSKVGGRSSGESGQTTTLAPTLVTIPATVGLAVTPQGKDVHAVLTFANVSGHPVFLDKISACASGKIGDDVFQIRADGQLLPFTGHRSQRPADPGPRQFITLAPGTTVSEEVILNHSYRFPSGTHDYTVTYGAQHAYPRAAQSFSLTSNVGHLATTR